MTSRPLSIYTLAVLAGYQPSPAGAAPAVPAIIPAVGFVHPTMREAEQALGASGGSLRDPAGFIYARHGAPTQATFEEAVAHLEGAEEAVSFSSGMAALHAALLSTVPPGGTVVAARQLYGVTRTLLDWLSSMSITVHYADFLDLEAVQQTIAQVAPAAVICEVLTNPLARVVQLDAVVEVSHRVGAKVIVDSTFTTPFLLQPVAMGADLVMHSTTKFLNGHGDVLGGVVVGSSELMKTVRGYRKLLGAMPGAFDAWLALRGLRTLAVRMRQSCLSARQIAGWLVEQELIKEVYYPGLSTDPCYENAGRLFRRSNYGSIVAFELRNAKRDAAFAFIERLLIIRPVTSLGDVNSLIMHPTTASHRSIPPEERAAQGITEGTLRLSVGIEDPNDLIADLAQALSGR